MRIVVITGPSGAGKTLALHSLEDAGYYAVDNLPPEMLPALVEFCRNRHDCDGAVVIDTRCGIAFAGLAAAIEQIKRQGYPVEMLYLDASDSVLLQRYKETRRPHPLRRRQQSLNHSTELAPENEGGIMKVIQAERELLDAARAIADRVLDTSSLSAHEFREAMHKAYAEGQGPSLLVTIVSFGFKHGLPVDADLVFDVRFLKNPHYKPELRLLDGRDAAVADYVNSDPKAPEFKAKMLDLIEYCLPEYIREGKAYLNIAIGCTGGQHRSVAISEEIAATLREAGYSVALQHRDVASKSSQDLD